MKVINLNLYDIDIDCGTLMVRQGKGKEDRMVPIGKRALKWIIKYRDEARSELITHNDDGTPPLTNFGQALTRNRMTQLVRDYVKAADIGKEGSCHLFRHTMAILMLENVADLSS